MAVVTTVVEVSNLHCISCCRSISDILLNLRAPPSFVSTRINGQQVTVTHSTDLSPREIVAALLDSGFEVSSITGGDNTTVSLRASTLSAYLATCTDRSGELEDARRFRDNYIFHGMGSDRSHLQHCEMCRIQAQRHANRGSRLSMLSNGGTRPANNSSGGSSNARTRPDSFAEHNSRRASRASWLYDGSLWFNRSLQPPIPTGEAVSYNLPSRPLRPASRRFGGSAEQLSIPNFSRPGSRVPSRPPSRPVSKRYATTPGIVNRKPSSMRPESLTMPLTAEKPIVGVSRSITPSPDRYETTSFLPTDDKPLVANVTTPSLGKEDYQVTISIGGMTCAVCTGKVAETLEAIDWVRDVNISLMTHSGTLTFDATRSGGKKEGVDILIDEIECLGYDATLYEIKRIAEPGIGSDVLSRNSSPSIWEAVISIGGMTCAVCTGKVAETMEAIEWVKDVNISLMTHSGTIQFDAEAAGGEKAAVDFLVDEVECLGYDASLDTLKRLKPVGGEAERPVTERRSIALRIQGLNAQEDIDTIIKTLEKDYPAPSLDIETAPTLRTPIMYISYIPSVPNFTIRHIVSTLKDINTDFEVSVYHPPSIEERAHEIQRRERRDLLIRLGICFIIVIPTFLIGIVWMSLVSEHNPQRMFFEQNMWKGAVSRTEWALLFLSTPVMFYCAEPFHRRAFREIVALWRRGSHVPMLRRFYRFGSMNLLISLGVTISWVSSVVMLGLATARHPMHTMKMETTTYFDSTVFLCFFLLIGRYLEAYSKAKTADAVSLITKLRPTEAVLVTSNPIDVDATPSRPSPAVSKANSTIEITASDPVEELTNPEYSTRTRTIRISADFIEIGDIVCIPHGTSPPADCIITSGTSSFDEASLTGEALLVPKTTGDEIFAGTINHGQVVNAIVQKNPGENMIDQIVNVVREGQNRHAPIERIADQVTAYFVPTICGLAITTWVVWLSLGVSGVLPKNWLDAPQGGWYFWSLSFAIAVFVVACPCGIGLAAPCAMHVGASLAARNAILAKGGGEAFQEASKLDVVVFDKTGTLTQGVEPVVSQELIVDTKVYGEDVVFYVTRALEETSVHPLARALVNHVDGKKPSSPQGWETMKTEEVPGKGTRGSFTSNNGKLKHDAVIGNERFLNENQTSGLRQHSALLNSWKALGNSVILLAIRSTPISVSSNGTPSTPSPAAFNKELGSPSSTQPVYTLAAIFATTDPIRPEASTVIRALQGDKIAVWMITGDNPITAAAVANQVGIPPENILANVLPTEKADKIRHLQSLPPLRKPSRWNIFPSSSSSKTLQPTTATGQRSIVAMIGDGINDAPALSISDVSVSIGSGSDVAMQTSKFILVSSDLRSLYTLLQLSRAVIRRVKFNFLWACIFNVLAIPLAAGVLYPTEKRVRLSPVWAALVMALSSVSVVGCSLVLKTRSVVGGFRPRALNVDGQRGGRSEGPGRI